MRRPARLFVLAVVLTCRAASAQPPAAVAPAAAPPPLASALPLDPAVTIGHLPNGLTYYIRPNTRPEKRVLAWLAVKAGSVFEDDDQRGLAHMLEHMAFNGSAHFKPGELVSFFETSGARFGPHVNAYTSFDETVYMLQVPTDKEGLVDKALLALADFAGGMSLDPKEIDKERGVVIEEWRLRQGASWRILEKQAPVLYYHSRYAERIPIGSPEILRTFTPQRLRDFYDTWYRPERMALVVVGEVTPQAIAPLIAQHFGSLADRRPASAPPPRDIPEHAATLINVAADEEAQSSSVSVLHKQPKLPQGHVGEYRRDLVRNLMYQMLNLRFSEIGQRPDAPFLAAGAGVQELGEFTNATSLGARVVDGGLTKGLDALIVEARRAREFGFIAGELDRARRSLLAAYERAYTEREKTESGSYAREYVGNFLDEEPIPGIAKEFELTRALLPTVTLDEAGAAARELLQESSRVVLATSPEKAAVTLPTEADMRAALTRAESALVQAWTETLARTDLLEKKPAPGRVVSTRTIAEIGVTVLTLSNGAEVWLKPTDFQNDQVLIRGYSPGGAASAPPSDYFETVLSSSLVSLAGVGGLKPPELAKVLAGRIAGVSPYIDLGQHGVRGSARPQDLEIAMQLLYLTFTAPGADAQALDLLKRQLSALIANRAQNPQAIYGDKLRALNTGDSYLVRPFTPEAVAALRLDVMTRAFAERFANATNFTFFVVGAFEPATIQPLIEQYIASLPGTGTRTAKSPSLGFKFPEQFERLVVEQGREPKSETDLTFFADAGGVEEQEALADAAASLLQIRLRDLLREELGGTYSVSVSYSNILPDPGYGTEEVSFGSLPENAETLTDAVLAEVKRLQAGGPSPEDCAKVRELERRELETAERQNGYWIASLQSRHLLQRDPAELATRKAQVDRFTPENLKAALNRYFPVTRYTLGRLLPAAPVSPASATPPAAAPQPATPEPTPQPKPQEHDH